MTMMKLFNIYIYLIYIYIFNIYIYIFNIYIFNIYYIYIIYTYMSLSETKTWFKIKRMMKEFLNIKKFKKIKIG